MKHPGRLIAVCVGSSIAAMSQWRFASRRRSGVDWRPPGTRTMLLPLAARVIGEGTPIVLLHGLGASGAYWGSAYDRLGDGHRLVVPDLLGFSASPRPAVGYGPAEHVAAIEACLDAAHVQQPAVVVAHSAGAIVALRLAATRRERERAVITFGPPLYPDPADARPPRSALADRPRRRRAQLGVVLRNARKARHRQRCRRLAVGRHGAGCDRRRSGRPGLQPPVSPRDRSVSSTCRLSGLVRRPSPPTDRPDPGAGAHRRRRRNVGTAQRVWVVEHWQHRLSGELDLHREVAQHLDRPTMPRRTSTEPLGHAREHQIRTCRRLSIRIGRISAVS